MNPRYRILKPREVAAILERMGLWQRQKGSYVQYRHSDGRTTTVPFHAGRNISPILLRQIVQDIGATIEKFYEHDKN